MGPLKMNAQMVLWSSDGSPIEHTRMHSQCVVYATSSVKQPFTFHFFLREGGTGRAGKIPHCHCVGIEGEFKMAST